MLNIFTVDLEEWYHPEYVREKATKNQEDRVTESLKKTLNLLKKHRVNATFFVVGELIEKHPEIVEMVTQNGHELAFHGYSHEPLWKLNKKKFELEINKFNSLMKEKCIGFRAPSFSLSNETKWMLKILESAGYKYDSSIFPAKTPLYGLSTAPTRPYKPSYEDVTTEDKNAQLWEFPLLVYMVYRLRIPVAGGFYLRFFPTIIIEKAIKKMNEQGFPAVLFLHNWELDCGTPRLRLGAYRSLVTYHKLEATEKKVNHILSNFEFTNFRGLIETFSDI